MTKWLTFLPVLLDCSHMLTIGEPVNKYRPNYKKLEFIRKLFFESVSNQNLDFEKYINYYRWLDDAVSSMVLNIVPASADFIGTQNMVESHMLRGTNINTNFPLIQNTKT